MRKSHRSERSGFTIIELLVVIGIIIVLVGILLPLVQHVRKAAFATNSQSMITNLGTACELYRQDNGAYPGIFPNSWFVTTATTCVFTPTAPATLPTGITASLTMTENMVLSLLGGLETAGYSGVQIGVGAMSANPVVASRKRLPPYFDATPGVSLQAQTLPLVAATPWNAVATSIAVDGWASTDMPTVPEFVDKFPDALPIIYFRANNGVTASIAGTLNTSHWNAAFAFPYIRTNPKDSTKYFPGSTEDLNGNGNTDVGEDLNGNNALNSVSEKDYSYISYFRNPAITTEPRQKDAFLLVGPGPDRKYGTRDDQTNAGSI